MNILTEWLFKHGGEIAIHDGKVSGYQEDKGIRFAGVEYDAAGTVEDLDERIKAAAATKEGGETP